MSGLSDVLRTVAPILASALGGPLAGAAVSFIANKFGIDPAVVEQTVAGMGPADLVKMKQIDLEFQLEMAKVGIQLQTAQIQVNAEEAKSESVFVAGWRPAVGWLGAFSLGYVAILEPFMRFFATVVFHYTGSFPLIDSSITLQILGGILGLGVMRSYDKKVGNGKEAGKA